MTRKIDRIYNYEGVNPFKDSQSRTFSDEKVVKEFCPTSQYWSLFNDQHEILIGTRGSGKTILLKMMRYSLLKHLHDEKAKKILFDKNYIAMYVPMNLEFIGSFSHQEVPEDQKLLYFQFVFNCSIAQSFLREIVSIIEDQNDVVERAVLNNKITKLLKEIWFSGLDHSKLSSLDDISIFINEMYYKNNIGDDGFKEVPKVFKSTICTPIQSVGQAVGNVLKFNKDFRWIVCIDEAEFLDELFLKCINTIFRSDSKGIIIKMATLPFRHITKETLTPNVFAEANGNDFDYRIVDMKHDQNDFINVTDALCKRRLLDTIPDFPAINSLEDFLGKVGEDDLIDYYRKETGTLASREEVESSIISQLSSVRQGSASKNLGSPKNRKTIYDRFAPVFYCREMYRISTTGNHVPAWYVGPRMFRRLSQGNPRMFIQLMNDLFEYARHHHLNFKAQHKVALNFCAKIYDTTKGLPIRGPLLHAILEKVSKELHYRTHDNFICDAGSAFTLPVEDQHNGQIVESIKLGIQYLRIVTDPHVFLEPIAPDTIFAVSNCTSAKFWLPMRKGSPPRISVRSVTQLFPPFSRRSKRVVSTQTSLFDSE